MADIEFKGAVVCDDIRREVSNKDILIGAFGGDVRVLKFPATLAPAFWVMINAKKVGDFSIEFRLVWSGNEEGKSSRGGKITVSQTGPAAATLPQVPIEFKEPGFFRLMGRIEQGEWEQIIERKVEAAT